MIKQKLSEFYIEANRNGFGGKIIPVEALKRNLKKFFEVTDRTVEQYVRESVDHGFIQNAGIGWKIIEMTQGGEIK